MCVRLKTQSGAWSDEGPQAGLSLRCDDRHYRYRKSGPCPDAR